MLSLTSILLLIIKSNHASIKTGVGISPLTKDINCNDLNVLTSPVWWYNWGTTSTFDRKNCSQHRTNVEYIPMIWGWWNQDLSLTPIPEDATTILGFNEPNLISQANLQPAAAVEGWKALQTVFHDKILVSPSASPCSGSGCIANFGSQEAWFDEFFRICNGTCKIDYLAVHLYWCYTLDTQYNVYDWRGSLWNLYNKYNIPLWLTEFNCWGATAEQQKYFMEQVIPVLDDTEWIAKYAWFMARELNYDDSLQLFTTNISQSKLTTLGDTYNKYSLSPTTSPTPNPTKNPSKNPTNNPSTTNPTQNPAIVTSDLTIATQFQSTEEQTSEQGTNSVDTVHLFMSILISLLCCIC